MRKAVIQIQCSRCERVEYKSAPEQATESSTASTLDVKLVVDGKAVMAAHFEDMCTPCVSTCKKYLELISKKIEGVSPVRSVKVPEPKPVAKPGAMKEVPQKGTPSAVSK
jgi:hypothetical protein